MIIEPVFKEPRLFGHTVAIRASRAHQWARRWNLKRRRTNAKVGSDWMDAVRFGRTIAIAVASLNDGDCHLRQTTRCRALNSNGENGRHEIRWFCFIRYDGRNRHSVQRRRPVLAVVTAKRSCASCAPQGRQAKDYAFEVAFTNSVGTTSVLLTDHLRNDDWKSRSHCPWETYRLRCITH